MKTLLLTTLLTLTASTAALATQISDPNGIMDEVNFFIEGREFKKEFIVGDSITVQTLSCDSDDNGDISCSGDSRVLEVEKVKNDVAIIGNWGISKARYEAMERNPLRLLLDFNELQVFLQQEKFDTSNSYMELVSYKEYFDTELNVDAMRIEILMVSEGEDYRVEIPMYVEVARGLPFIGQVSDFGFKDSTSGMEFPLYQVTDWIKML